MKKRLLALLLAGAMTFGLAACGNGDQGSAESPPGTPPTYPKIKNNGPLFHILYFGIGGAVTGT